MSMMPGGMQEKWVVEDTVHLFTECHRVQDGCLWVRRMIIELLLQGTCRG